MQILHGTTCSTVFFSSDLLESFDSLPDAGGDDVVAPVERLEVAPNFMECGGWIVEARVDPVRDHPMRGAGCVRPQYEDLLLRLVFESCRDYPAPELLAPAIKFLGILSVEFDVRFLHSDQVRPDPFSDGIVPDRLGV